MQISYREGLAMCGMFGRDRGIRASFGKRGIRQRQLLLVLVLPSLACFGCHRGPTMYHVKGTVHYKNGGVPQGTIRIVGFAPTSESTAEVRKGATGEIQPDGSFEMTTRVPGDGAY